MDSNSKLEDTKICYSEECGKYVTSTRPFKAGETIAVGLEFYSINLTVLGLPYSVITSHQYKNLICNTCLKTLQKVRLTSEIIIYPFRKYRVNATKFGFVL